ncbi:hypothetical protein MEX01_17210 [Methylorubrum extorquens]|nr:hypothetical protein MEX01_17210 [Methylorubrum extorquens]
MTALEADDDIGLLREPIDDLALALVAPLGAYDDDVRHARLTCLELAGAGAKRLRHARKPRPSGRGSGIPGASSAIWAGRSSEAAR